MHRIMFLFLYFFCASFSFAVNFTIPDGSFVELQENLGKSYNSLYLYYNLNGVTVNVGVIAIDKRTGEVVIFNAPYYASGDKVLSNPVYLNDVAYNLYSEESQDIDNDETVNDDYDDIDDNVTIEKVVYLNRIELYLLWLLCVQCISCGILLFLSFKGFERL